MLFSRFAEVIFINKSNNEHNHKTPEANNYLFVVFLSRRQLWQLMLQLSHFVYIHLQVHLQAL